MLEDEHKIDKDGWTIIGSHYVNMKTGHILKKESGVAQLVEHLTHIQAVAGSTPALTIESSNLWRGL